MSNRFRKLKLTQTLRHGFPSNQFVPFPDEMEPSLNSTVKVASQSDTDTSGSLDAATAWNTNNKASGKGRVVLWEMSSCGVVRIILFLIYWFSSALA